MFSQIRIRQSSKRMSKLLSLFSLFSSRVTAATFASTNVSRGHRFCYTLENKDLSLTTQGKEGILCLCGFFSSFALLLADPVHPYNCSKNYPCLGELASLTDRFCPLLSDLSDPLWRCFCLVFFLTWWLAPESHAWSLKLQESGSKTTVPSGELKLLASNHLFCH